MGVTDIYWPVLHSINLGRFGVILFFLISGFVIPPSLERHGASGFAINRAFRLLPALWLSIACAVLFRLIDGLPVSASALLANLFMVAKPLGQEQFASVYWTLSVELGFYVQCVLLYLGGQLGNWRLTTGIGIFLTTTGAVLKAEMVTFPAYMLVGMAWRRALDGDRQVLPWAIGGTLVLVICGGMTSIHPNGNPVWMPFGMLTGSALAIPVFLIVILTNPKAVGEPKALSAFVWLGSISYSIYLFQIVAFWAIPPVSGAVYPMIVLFAVLAIASVVHRFVEQPAIKFGKKAAFFAASKKSLPA